MEDIKWIFDGIGTAVVTFLAGLLIGGGAGYRIAMKKKKIKQKQKAGDNANQTQIGEINNGG